MIREDPALRDRVGVFRDRAHAGRVLAGLLEGVAGPDAVVLAIPAGGVPVAASLARARGLPLDAVVVSKATLPWNPEVGFGAVAFDGTSLVNHELVERMGLDAETVRAGLEAARAKVARRVTALGAGRRAAPHPAEAVVVDDGLASGFTMRAAVEALRRAGVARIVVAVPTGSERTVRELAPGVAALVCANVRGGWRFAVADAYEDWHDVPEAEAARLLVEAAGEAAGDASDG